MYNVSENFKSEVKKPTRTIDSKVVIGQEEYGTDIIIDFTVDSSFGSEELPVIGSCISKELKMKLVNDDSLPDTIINTPIKPMVAIEVDGQMEWVPVGVFYATTGDIEKTDLEVEISSFDIIGYLSNSDYVSELEYPTDVENVISEIENQFSVSISRDNVTSYDIPVKPKGNLRKTLGYIASLFTSNCTTDLEGNIKFVSISDTSIEFNADHFIDFKLANESDVQLTRLMVEVDSDDEEEDLNLYSGNTTGFTVSIENDFIDNESQLTTIYNRQYPLTYTPYTLEIQGMPHLEVGDKFVLIDDKHEGDSIVRNLIVGSHKLTYNGSISSKMEMSSPRTEDTVIDNTSTSSVVKTIRRNTPEFEDAVKNATQIITGNEGGNILTRLDENDKPYEILIMDTDDIDTATNIWRWNNNGLGYSTDGIEGPYELAITSDGSIVADFITSGTLNAELITTGILESFNGSSWIDMESGEFSFGNGVISFLNNSFTIDLSGTSISSDIEQAEQNAKDYTDGKISESENAVKEYADAVAENKSAQAQADAELYTDGKVSDETQARLDQASANLQEAKDYAEQKASDAEGNAISHTDTQFTILEGEISSRVTQTDFETGINETKSYADGVSETAENNAKSHADTKAQEAENSAKAYAEAQAELERLEAIAQAEEYADGKVSQETQDRIAQAEQNLSEAKTYAETKASEAENNAKTYADTASNERAREILGVTQHDLANTTVFDEFDEDGGFHHQTASWWGIRFEVDNDIHLGQTTIYTDGEGEVRIRLRRFVNGFDDSVVETEYTKDFDVVEGKNVINLDMLVPSEKGKEWLLTATPINEGPGIWRSDTSLTDFPYDSGSFRVVAGGSRSSSNNRWYYFFDLEIAGLGVRGQSIKGNPELLDRLTQTETEIVQNSEQIALRATKSELDEAQRESYYDILNGPVSQEIRDGGYFQSTNNHGIFFEIQKSVHIKRLKVFVEDINGGDETGEIGFMVRIGSGRQEPDTANFGSWSAVHDKTFEVSLGENILEVDIVLDVETTKYWQIALSLNRGDDLVGIARTARNQPYPFKSGSLEITAGGQISSPNNRFYYFYDVEARGDGIHSTRDTRERLYQAEIDIQPDAIISTVTESTEYINDLGEKVGEDEVISKINQTAESIKIQAEKIDLQGKVTITDFSNSLKTEFNSKLEDSDVGDLAYEDVVESAKLGSTIISGGYIRSNLLTADNIVTGTMSADRIDVDRLSSLSADIGHVTAGNITGVNIEGSTFYSANAGVNATLSTTITGGWFRNESEQDFGIGVIEMMGGGIRAKVKNRTNRYISIDGYDGIWMRDSGDLRITRASIRIQDNDHQALSIDTSGSPYLRWDMGGSSTSGYYRNYSWGSDRSYCLESMGDVVVVIDYNNNQSGKSFRVMHDGEGTEGNELFRVEENGDVKLTTGMNSVLHARNIRPHAGSSLYLEDSDGVRGFRMNRTGATFYNGLGVGTSNPVGSGLLLHGDLNFDDEINIVSGNGTGRIYTSSNLLLLADNDIRFSTNNGTAIGNSVARFYSSGNARFFNETQTMGEIKACNSSNQIGYYHGGITDGDLRFSTRYRNTNTEAGWGWEVNYTRSGEDRPYFVISTNGDIHVTDGDIWYYDPPTTSFSSNTRIGSDTGRLLEVSSSKRYKQDIKPLNDDVKRSILQANPVLFRDKNDVKERGDKSPFIAGFIAEEFEELGLIELLTYKKGRVESVQYDRIPAYLLGILKDHDKQLQELNNKINDLESKLKDSK